MKLKDKQLLHDQTLPKLNQELENTKEELAKAKLDAKVGKLANVREAAKLRNKIATLKTIIQKHL